MDNFGKAVHDPLDLTDSSTESSSSSKSGSGLFPNNQPLVLELHDIKKDTPATERATPEAKSKKKKRRGHLVSENKTGSTASSTVSIPTVTDSAGKEEFFDADGSQHDLAAKPAAALTLALQQSVHNQDPKLNPEATTRTSATPREPSNTITKPVNLPPPK